MNAPDQSARREIGIPERCGMRQLEREFGNLYAHAILTSGFFATSGDKRTQFLMLLVFRMNRARWHYAEARASVIAQIDEVERWKHDTSGGQGLPILAFSSSFDDCLTDLYLVNRTIDRMETLAHPALKGFAKTYAKVLKTITIMRTDSQHMEDRIGRQVLDGGPVQPAITKDGDCVVLGTNEVSLKDVADCIEGLFDALFIAQ